MAMLGDADAEIQGDVLAFWHSALPCTLSGRLAALLCDNLDMATAWVWHMLCHKCIHCVLIADSLDPCLAFASQLKLTNGSTSIKPVSNADQGFHSSPCAVQKDRLEGQWPHSASRLLLRLSANERAYDAPIFDTGEPLT